MTAQQTKAQTGKHRAMPRSIPRAKRIPSGRGSRSGIHSCTSEMSLNGRGDRMESPRRACTVMTTPSPRSEHTEQSNCQSKSHMVKLALILPCSRRVPFRSLSMASSEKLSISALLIQVGHFRLPFWVKAVSKITTSSTSNYSLWVCNTSRELSPIYPSDIP